MICEAECISEAAATAEAVAAAAEACEAGEVGVALDRGVDTAVTLLKSVMACLSVCFLYMVDRSDDPILMISDFYRFSVLEFISNDGIG